MECPLWWPRRFGRPQGVQVIAALHRDHVAAATREIEAAVGVLPPGRPEP
jgi:hypothetical protein